MKYHFPYSVFGQLHADASVWQWAAMTTGKSDSYIVRCHKSFICYLNKKGPHNIQRIHVGQWSKKCTVCKMFMGYLSKWFSLDVTKPPRHQCQLSIIRFVPKISCQDSGLFLRVLAGYWQNGRFHWSVFRRCCRMKFCRVWLYFSKRLTWSIQHNKT